MSNFKPHPLALALSTIMLLSGCGGGGGSSSHSGTVGSDKTTTPKTTETTPKTTQTTPVVDNNPTYIATDKVKVAVIDSGAVVQNVLKDSVLKIEKYNSTTSTATDIALDADPTLQDVATNKHGSFTSSVIAGSDYNGSTKGLAAGKVALYEMQVTDADGKSNTYANFRAMLSIQKSQGVNIFNNSWGSYVAGGDYKSNASTVALASQVVANGGLMMFSTGNNGSRTNPSETSLFPNLDFSIKNGLIAVTGVNADKTIATNANICGAAGAWCLAGDYFSKAYYIEGLGGSYVYSGTSGAAPQVTAEAALIADKFKWMSNTNLKYTILTTATYLDDGSTTGKPYNSTYGWGYFNIDKALMGPSKFYSELGNFSADVTDGYASDFSNDIDGDAGLTKSGNGKLTLSGNDTYTGNTTISGGELEVTGKVNNSAFTINNGGMLSGNGSVGSVSNSGTITTSEGAMSINGNYVQNSNGVFDLYLKSPLSVSGSASLSGTLNVYSKDQLFGNGDYTVLNSNGVSGQFDKVNSGSSFLKVNSVNYGQNEVTANVALVSASTAGTQSNSASKVGGSMVDQTLTQATTTSNNAALKDYALGIESSSSSEQAQSIMNTNTGVIYSEVPSVILNNQSVQNSLLSQHIYDTTKDGKTGVWFNTNGIHTKNKANGWNTASTSAYNYTVGGDYAVSDDVMLGGSVSKGTLNTKVSDGAGKADTRMTNFMGYGKVQQDHKGLYGVGAVGYGFGNTEIKRGIDTGTGYYNTDNNTNVRSASAYAETGYDYDLPNSAFAISPFVGLGFSYAKINGLKENSVYGLNVGSTNVSQFELSEGFRASYLVSNGFNVHGYVARKDIIGRNSSQQDISLNLAGSVNESYSAPKFEKGSYLYDVGFDYSPVNQWLFSTDFMGINGKSDSYSLQVSAKYQF